jgi:hypothetical protein
LLLLQLLLLLHLLHPFNLLRRPHRETWADGATLLRLRRWLGLFVQFVVVVV